jgi:hypothetical protein
MSDQNVITDWPAYFKALGPGKPFTPEEIARMCALTKHTRRSRPSVAWTSH